MVSPNSHLSSIVALPCPSNFVFILPNQHDSQKTEKKRKAKRKRRGEGERGKRKKKKKKKRKKKKKTYPESRQVHFWKMCNSPSRSEKENQVSVSSSTLSPPAAQMHCP